MTNRKPAAARTRESVMTKKQITPLYDVKAPFIESLTNYTGAAEILASSVSALLSTKNAQAGNS
jgi:hypothetical protein